METLDCCGGRCNLYEDVASKCARCGEPLEDGYAMAARGLWWDRKPLWILPAGETIISQGNLSAPAQRCFNCKVIIIQAP